MARSDAALKHRWRSVGIALVDAVGHGRRMELAGDRLLLDLAEKQGQLDAIEDRSFRFGRILAGQR